MTPTPDRLGIVVVNFGASHLLSRTLASVGRSTPAVVVVVDCFSSDVERGRIRSLARREGWNLLLLADNRGFGGGMNVGMAKAVELGCTRFLLLNPDASIDPDSVRRLEEVVYADPLALVSPRVIDGTGRTWFAGADLYLADGSTRARARRGSAPPAERWEWLSGACLMLTARLRDLVGGFDEDFFLYWEDIDLSRRVVAAGGRLVVLDAATAVHDEGGTHRDRVSSRAKSGTYYRYMIRNRMLFASKHLDDDGVRRWLRSDVSGAWAILLQGGRRQFLHPYSPVSAALRGLREGRAFAAARLAREKKHHRRTGGM